MGVRGQNLAQIKLRGGSHGFLRHDVVFDVTECVLAVGRVTKLVKGATELATRLLRWVRVEGELTRSSF